MPTKKVIEDARPYKKMTFQQNFKRGVIGGKAEIVDIAKRSTIVFIKQQTRYDDGSESAVVEIHFMPKVKEIPSIL